MSGGPLSQVWSSVHLVWLGEMICNFVNQYGIQAAP
jgi:hypothetical protein